MTQDATTLTVKIGVLPEFNLEFADWQSRLNEAVALFPGFISLEIISIAQGLWVISIRFDSTLNLSYWKHSKEKIALFNDLSQSLGNIPIQEIESIAPEKARVTEVFVTEVKPENDKAFRKWIAKIHEEEAKFPGFQGVFVQSPSTSNGKNWITMLQFDTPLNLNRWIESTERKAILNEAKPIIASLQNHRVISSYAGWFNSLGNKNAIPPVWKQTMIVLLVLFPIVMLELKLLSPLTAALNPSLGTFIGNALSVSLIAWPMMPIAIYFLNWWLDQTKSCLSNTILGIFVVSALYLIEMALFWHFL